MWQVMRSAIEIQKARRFQSQEGPELGCIDVFRMATSESANALGHNTGTIEIGAEADLLQIDLNQILPPQGKFTAPLTLSAEELLTLLVYRGNPHATIQTFIRGRNVSPKQGNAS